MGEVKGIKSLTWEKVKPVLVGIGIGIIVATALGAILNGSLALHGSDKSVQLDIDHYNIMPIGSVAIGGLALIALIIGGGIYLKRKKDVSGFGWTLRMLRLSDKQLAILRDAKELNEKQFEKIVNKLVKGEKVLYKMDGRTWISIIGDYCVPVRIPFDEFLKTKTFDEIMERISDIDEVMKR